MSTVRKAFLSSTCEDLQEYRDMAYETIEGPSWHCVRQEDFGAVDNVPVTECRRRVQDCELLVCLVGPRYGSCPKGSDKSFTEHEYEAALEDDIPRLVFMTADDFPLRGDLRETDDMHGRQQDFRERVQDDRVIDKFGTPDELGRKIAIAVGNHERREGPPVVDYDAGKLSEAEAPPAPTERATTSLQAKLTVRTPAAAPKVVEVLSLRRLAESEGLGFDERARASASVTGPTRRAFWLLQFVLDAKWLPVLSSLLRRELRDRPDELLWPVAQMLVRVAKQDPEAVVDSGLLPVLWSGGDEGHLWHALSVIEAGGLWEHEALTPLLGEAPTASPENLGHIAFQLASWGKQSDSAATFALHWIAQWLKVAPERDVERGALRLSVPFALGELAQARPDAVSQSAIPLLDAALLRQDPEDVAFRLRYHFGDDMRGEAPVLQVRRVLADKLGDAHKRPAVLSILADLLCSDNAAKRAVALDVAREDPVGCKDLVVQAARDARNFEYPLSEWTDYLIHDVYGDLSGEDKCSVEEALLSLPDEAPDEGKDGFVKRHALAAIPEELGSDEVRRAIADLHERFPDLPARPYQPREPGSEMRVHAYPTGEDVDDEVASLTGNPLALIDHYLQGWEQNEPAEGSGWFNPITVELAAALERSPREVTPMAQALAQRGADLPQRLMGTLVTAVASATRTCKELDGQKAYDIATLLQDVLTSEARHGLGPVLAERWDQISDEHHAGVVALLERWLAEEPEPTDKDTELLLGDGGWPDAADAGLNTARGAIAVALVDIAAKAKGDVQRTALEAVMTASQDSSPLVRAILAHWVAKLSNTAEHAWLVEVAQRCISDFSPHVLPSIPHVFRGLLADEIREFGANVVRVMLASGEDAAKGAGFLAAIWSLRYPSEVTIGLVDEVLATDSVAAKSEAAHVFAHNVLDEDQTTSDECMRRCQLIAAEQPAEVQKSLYRNLPRPKGLPSGLAELLRLAAVDPNGSGFEELHHRLHLQVRKEEQPNPDAVKVIVEGLLDNPNKELLGSYLRESFYLLGDVFDTLSEQGEKELALRLLDAACHHCVPAAADLLDEGKALLREMGELPEDG